jgi:hypothetical protein
MPKRELFAKLLSRKYGSQIPPLKPNSSSNEDTDPPFENEGAEVNESKVGAPEQSAASIASTSCWNRALERLKQEHNGKYHELKIMVHNDSEMPLEPTTLVTLAEEKIQKLDTKDWRSRRITRQVLGALTSLERVLKAVALLDPSGGASIAHGGIYGIVQVALVDINQYQFALTSVTNLSSVIERWMHFEQRDLNSSDCDLQETEAKFIKSLRLSLVDLYLDIMIHLATMAKYCQKSNPGTSLGCPFLLCSNLLQLVLLLQWHQILTTGNLNLKM